MTTATRVGPQLKLGEQLLDDEQLETLLTERLAAKVAYDDARAYLEDYLDQKQISAGEFRVGQFRLKLSSRRGISITVPTK